MSRVYRSIGKTVNGRTAYVCPHLAVWWPEFERLVEAELGVRMEVIQARGGAAASAGTHAHGTALDLRTWRFTRAVVDGIVRLAREAGAPATWYRTRAQGFDPHIHLVLDCSCWSNADYQITAVKAGFNGLGKGGRGGTDDGWKPSSAWRNYVSGLHWARQEVRALSVSGWEEYMAGKTDEDMKKLIVAAIKEFFYDDLAGSKSGDRGVDGSRNNALYYAARDRTAEVRKGVNQALWDPLVEGNEGVTGTSVRNVLLHIYATSVAALGAVREIASGTGVELDASVFAEGLPDAVADEVLERLGAAIVKA